MRDQDQIKVKSNWKVPQNISKTKYKWKTKAKYKWKLTEKYLKTLARLHSYFGKAKFSSIYICQKWFCQPHEDHCHHSEFDYYRFRVHNVHNMYNMVGLCSSLFWHWDIIWGINLEMLLPIHLSTPRALHLFRDALWIRRPNLKFVF